MPDQQIRSFTSTLPKVDLHLHLLGSATPGTIAELAARHPEQEVPADPAEVARYCDYRDFAHFIAVYTAVNRLVTSGPDVVTLAERMASDLVADNVRYAEVTVTPLSHVKAGVGAAELAEALELGRRAAAARGLEVAWVIDVSADDGPAGGHATLDWLLRHQPVATVAFGLGGPEKGAPRKTFRGVFARARAEGLHSVAHAGETTGPGEILAAVEDLGAERVGHGIGAALDPSLLDRLTQLGVTLEQCPTSNVATGAVSSLAGHPLPGLLASGVPVTLGTDDPGMFRTTLSNEYLICHRHFGLRRADLLALARAGVDASFCGTATRKALHTELDQFARTHS